MLTVEGLSKTYPHFTLADVSLSVEPGYIQGFVGANGAGKTTTLKSILGIVRADSGTVTLLGRPLDANPRDTLQQIGVSLGPAAYYPASRLSTITAAARRLYREWDQDRYEQLIARFGLDPRKRISQLSTGMRVKYGLALALSHRARLLIFDEPTSGLDPVARDDLTTLFQEVIEDGQTSVLFSTHITSDLDKCADAITFIDAGHVVLDMDKDDLLESHRIVRGRRDQLPALEASLIGIKRTDLGFSGLARSRDVSPQDGLVLDPPTLDDIMVYHSAHTSREDAR